MFIVLSRRTVRRIETRNKEANVSPLFLVFVQVVYNINTSNDNQS